MFRFLGIGGEKEKVDQSRNEGHELSDAELRREIQEEIFRKIDGRLFQGGENVGDLDEGEIIVLIGHEGEVLDGIFSNLANTKKSKDLSNDERQLLLDYGSKCKNSAEVIGKYGRGESDTTLLRDQLKEILDTQDSLYIRARQLGLFRDTKKASN